MDVIHMSASVPVVSWLVTSLVSMRSDASVEIIGMASKKNFLHHFNSIGIIYVDNTV
jgi:hypothetical protein